MNWWMLRRKVHSSWLIGVAAFGTTAGVIGAQYCAYRLVGELGMVLYGGGVAASVFVVAVVGGYPFGLCGGLLVWYLARECRE